MKKKLTIFLTIATVLLYTHIAIAVAKINTYTAPQKPYPVSNRVSRGVQRIFGLNLAATAVAEHEIKKQLKANLNGDYKVKLKAYSAFDLIDGKFKSISLEGKNIDTKNFAVSYFNAASVYDFIYVDLKQIPGTVVLKEPLSMNFNAELTEDNINKILSSTPLKFEVKLLERSADLIKLINPKAQINGDKITLETKVHLNGMPDSINMPVKITSKINIKDNKVYLNDTITNSLIVDAIVHKANLMVVDLNTLFPDGKKLTMKNLKISNKKIYLSGNIWLPEGPVQ